VIGKAVDTGQLTRMCGFHKVAGRMSGKKGGKRGAWGGKRGGSGGGVGAEFPIHDHNSVIF